MKKLIPNGLGLWLVIVLLMAGVALSVFRSCGEQQTKQDQQTNSAVSQTVSTVQHQSSAAEPPPPCSQVCAGSTDPKCVEKCECSRKEDKSEIQVDPNLKAVIIDKYQWVCEEAGGICKKISHEIISKHKRECKINDKLSKLSDEYESRHKTSSSAWVWFKGECKEAIESEKDVQTYMNPWCSLCGGEDEKDAAYVFQPETTSTTYTYTHCVRSEELCTNILVSKERSTTGKVKSDPNRPSCANQSFATEPDKNEHSSCPQHACAAGTEGGTCSGAQACNTIPCNVTPPASCPKSPCCGCPKEDPCKGKPNCSSKSQCPIDTTL